MKKIEYKTYKKPTDMMRFLEGENRIRIVSDGMLSMEHSMVTARGFIPLGTCTEDQKCEHCAKGSVAKVNFTWIVLDLVEKKLKVIKTGIGLGDMIASIGRESGDPKTYDLKVVRTGQMKQTKYMVVKLPERTMDDAEVTLIRNDYARMSLKYLGGK